MKTLTYQKESSTSVPATPHAPMPAPTTTSKENSFRREKADVWYHGWENQNGDRTWDEFAEAFYRRFGKLSITDVVEEFNKIKQSESIEEYQQKFKELKSLMLKHHPWLDESYFFLASSVV
ncbi:conserved hypothetical protein [Ricinus communis]|uniref:Ty3 transposon capsid-like protein domain-containing protein n=1 Tax=Ricinus communis TaxID=3988 RepID=B9RSG9_RICCO|nr:conserved hypothetical protein [Ricinus communis]